MSPHKGAFIGFGNIAEKGHWPTYKTSSAEARIVAVMEPSPVRQEAARAAIPGVRIYGDTDEMFRAESLDFVDICTPPALHAPLALEALEHGAHVLCEKPLSLKPSDYETLAAAAQRTGKTVFTVHNWKYAPIFQKALELIREERIGKVWHVEIFTLRNNVCKGAAQGAGGSEDWRTQREIAGGGILVDHGWHAFYLLLNLVGAEPESVLAKMLRGADDENALEEAVQALVQFPEADGYVHLTWRSPLRRNSMIVQGQTGTLLIDDDRILLTQHDGRREELAFGAALSAGSHHADWFEALFPDFLAELRDPARRGQNFREAGWCLALMSAAYQSNLQGFKEIQVAHPTISRLAPVL